jgi:hypothetical protein
MESTAAARDFAEVRLGARCEVQTPANRVRLPISILSDTVDGLCQDGWPLALAAGHAPNSQYPSTRWLGETEHAADFFLPHSSARTSLRISRPLSIRRPNPC